MKVLVSYSPSIGKETSKAVEFGEMNEWRDLPVDNPNAWARVKVIKVQEDPTPDKTGSAIYNVEYSNGKKHEDIGIICKPRGGTRPGAGRKASTPGLTVQVAVRISEEAAQVLSEKPNKSEYINNLILNNK